MYGRNGADDIYRLFLVLWFILFLTSLFVQNAIAKMIFSVLLWAILIYITFRIFSRNISARQAENMRYVRFKQRMFSNLRLQKRKIRERKTHVYHKCPDCKATLRLPRKKGLHRVTCPKCRHEFEVKVR